MDKLLREIGDRVKQVRLARGLSQSELAEKLGLSDAYVSKIELGKNAMSVTVLIKLSDTLDVSADWLLRNRTREAREISVDEVEAMFMDCSPAERNTLMKLLQEMKTAFRDLKQG